MSGHSKWAKIHRAKEASDLKKGQSFTKLSNAITLAVRESGIADPNFNFKLRLAIEKARAANMPKENISRAIERATGKGEGSSLEEVVYEGYGPGGVGFLVQTVTDNRQRTIQEVKNAFDRAGGTVASPGAVSFNFKKVGYLTVKVENGSSEEIALKIMDWGVDDVEDEGEGVLGVYTSPENLMEVKDKLVKAGLTPTTVEIIMRPINFIPITDSKTAQQNLSLLEKLESLDDVQKVFVNFDIPDEHITTQTS